MNEHSPKFNKVKSNYYAGFWNKMMVRNAVDKHWITSMEYEEITGDTYED